MLSHNNKLKISNVYLKFYFSFRTHWMVMGSYTFYFCFLFHSCSVLVFGHSLVIIYISLGVTRQLWVSATVMFTLGVAEKHPRLPPPPNFKHLGILYIFFRVLIKWLPFLLHFSSNGILNCNPLGSLLWFLSTLATMLNPLCCYSSLQSLRHFPFPWIKIKVFKANLVTSFFFHIFFCYFISFKLNLILHHRLSVCKFYTYK